MSKTTRNTEVRDELSGNELDTVTGGSFEIGNIVAQVNKATQVGLGEGGADVWVGCAWVPQWW